MFDGDPDWIDQVAREIEEHVAAHPDAADTSEGIATWWIGRQRFLEAERTIEMALDRLVAQGRMERRRQPGGAVLYRMARGRGDG
jgi:hypothetical protein